MKTRALTFTASITAIAVIVSLYLGNSPELTPIQQKLANTANQIILLGSTSIFGLLNAQAGKNSDT